MLHIRFWSTSQLPQKNSNSVTLLTQQTVSVATVQLSIIISYWSESKIHLNSVLEVCICMKLLASNRCFHYCGHLRGLVLKETLNASPVYSSTAKERRGKPRTLIHAPHTTPHLLLIASMGPFSCFISIGYSGVIFYILLYLQLNAYLLWFICDF